MKNFQQSWAVILAAFAFLPLAAGAVQQSKPKGAKALFYDPGQQQAPPPAPRPAQNGNQQPQPQTAQPAPSAPPVANPGIRYWIELEGVGEVTDNRTFRTGDRIKLHTESNADGYLTLWTKDGRGQFHQLFPEVGAVPGSNFLRAHSPYATPGHIVFKPPVSDEHMLIHFSQTPGDRPNPQSALVDARVAASPGAQGAKALSFEREEEEPQEVGTYVVNQSGGPVMIEVRLHHRR